MNPSRVLIATALLFTTGLSAALTYLGLDKFHYLLAGGRKFATFPDAGSQLGIGLTYLLLSLLYLVWLLWREPIVFARFGNLLQRTAPFWLLAWVAYPLGNDVYLYLHTGLMNLRSVNPFLTGAGAFISELMPFVDWQQTSTYGPISQLLFSISAVMTATSPIVAVYVFKSFCLGLHLFNAYWIWRSLPMLQRDTIAIAYLVHPLLLMEQVAAAHVDVLVSTSFVVLAASLAKRQNWVALAALWGGFLSKTLPLIWVPLVVIFWIRQRNWRFVWQAKLGSIVTIVVLSLTVFPTLSAWTSLLNPGVTGQYQSSLHTLARFCLDLVRLFLPQVLTLGQQRSLLDLLTQGTLFGFLAFYGWTAWRRCGQSSYALPTLLEDLGWVTLVLFLIATSWVMPWYASILLTIAAFLPGAEVFGLTSLMFALSSSAQYVLQGHNSLRSLVSIGVPLLTWVLAIHWLRRSRPDSPNRFTQKQLNFDRVKDV